LRGVAWGFIAGLVLGATFFLGLWWTVRRIPGSSHPGLLVGTSLLIRMATVGALLLLLIRGSGWLAGVAALAGMLLARWSAVRLAHSRARREIAATAWSSTEGGGGGPWS
jgi:F1F0 ATPase subunit 2